MSNPSTTNIRRRPGNQVVRLIRRAGWTQGLIAEGIGVSQGAVSAVIHRRRSISPKLAERIWHAIEKAVEDPGGAAR